MKAVKTVKIKKNIHTKNLEIGPKAQNDYLPTSSCIPLQVFLNSTCEREEKQGPKADDPKASKGKERGREGREGRASS